MKLPYIKYRRVLNSGHLTIVLIFIKILIHILIYIDIIISLIRNNNVFNSTIFQLKIDFGLKLTIV